MLPASAVTVDPSEWAEGVCSPAAKAPPEGDAVPGWLAGPVGTAPDVLIGLIAPPWLPTPPRRYGGTEQVVDLLARGLVAAGHEVLLFATGDSTCPVPRRSLFDTPAFPMCESVPEAAHVVAAYEALRHVDVIHDHTVLGPLIGAPTARVPVVVTNHGPFTTTTRPLFATAARHATVVAISNAHAATAMTDVPIGAVIHHGLDVDHIPVGEGRGGYVAFVGRMANEKGAHRAIDAARRLGIPIKIAAKCSEDAEVAYFEAMIRPRLGAGVEFLGEVGGDDKWDLMGNAMALVNPIEWDEPFGLVMAESLACGTPVVTMSWGAAPEIVDHGETGFVCDDESQLSRALASVDVIDRAHCRKAAVTRLSSSRMVSDHVSLYSSLLAASPTTALPSGARRRAPGASDPLQARSERSNVRSG